MKSLPVATFLFSLFAVCAFFVLETKANGRPPRVSEIKNCIAQNEKDFGAAPTVRGDAAASLKKTEGYVSQLDELIGCVNQGLKIQNLHWHLRRDWLVKRFEYYQMRQVFAQYSCYYRNAAPAEKLMAVVNRKIENRQKRAVLRDLNLLQKSAFRAKACSDRAARFRHIEPEFKDGFREISAQTDELIEKVRELRATVKKLPE